MRYLLCLTILMLGLGSWPPAVVAQSSAPAPAEGGAGLPPEKIDELVAPIALYPDVLVSQILPASTFPMDVVKAARWLRSKPDMSTLPKQEWDLSILSLCHYPDVIYKMDEDLDWTSALGATFVAQPTDVMNAVQRLRLLAQANGALKTTEQQTVVVEKETIRIVPSQPQVIYVPTYNPQVVYVQQQPSAATVATASAISFSVGLAMGNWLHHDCDWHGGAVVYCKPGYWGGYAHRGAVVYNDNWAAAVGPRGAAVWGPNGGAAWRRPTPYGAPTYGGRYSSYGSYRGNTAVGNSATVNRNTVNVDRGDRNTAVRGGNTNVGVGGNRTNIGQPGASGGAAQRPNAGRPTQLPSNNAGAGRPGGSGSASQRPDAGRPTQLPSNSASGRTADRSSAGSARPSPSGSSARPSATSSSGRSAFSDFSGSSQARSYSSRGSASRSSAGASRSSGGGRSGGGRRSGGGGGRR